jgi:hypothetical protein
MRVMGQLLFLALVLSLASLPAATAQTQPSVDKVAKQNDGLQSRVVERRSRPDCDNQVLERKLSGRMARSFRRLCLSGLPLPKPFK